MPMGGPFVNLTPLLVLTDLRVRLRLGWARAVKGPFRNLPGDPEKLRKFRNLPQPTTTYAIHFAPRSGSSRLADILKRAGGLSQPGECFEPENMQRNAAFLGAGDLDTYIQAISRQRGGDGVFGFKISPLQMLQAFGTEPAFHRHFAGAKPIWLIREDIVAQAVSVTRMLQTGVAHASGQAPQVEDAAFTYAGHEIGKWVRLLLWMETRTERFFETYNLNPLRFSYERLLAFSPAQTVQVVRGYLGLGGSSSENLETSHRKLGTDTNRAFADRFREEQPHFIDAVAQRRRAMIENLVDLEPRCDTPDA